MDQARSEQQAATGKAGGSRQDLFSDEPLLFELLDAVDADIGLNARNIKARDAALEFGQLALQLDTGDLRVERLEATYRGTKVSANLNLAAGTPATVAIGFLVQGFDLGRFLKEPHVSQDVEAQVDLAADLKSQGNSSQSLPDSRSVATKGTKALSALVLGPAGLLVPFIKAGARNQHPCDVEELKNKIHSIYR